MERIGLTGDGIVLRPVAVGDVEALYEAAWRSHAEIWPWMEWCHPAYAREDSSTWLELQQGEWESGREYAFATLEEGTGRFLGTCGINQINTLHRFANLGYWTRSDAAGRGVATAATKLLVAFAFERLALDRIEIIASVENVASCRVAIKSGATFEGVLRSRLQLHGRAHDVAMHSHVRPR